MCVTVAVQRITVHQKAVTGWVTECHSAVLQTAQGHGDPINDIAVHPMRPSIVLTASRVGGPLECMWLHTAAQTRLLAVV